MSNGRATRGWLGWRIPKDASVDPARFDEDEFPVVCPKCGYALRGLADGACPECGVAFERGRLLVQQYVRQTGRPSYGRAGKLASACILIASTTFLVFLFLFSSFLFARWRASDPRRLQLISTYLRYQIPVISLGSSAAVLFFSALCVKARCASRNAEKRQRILDALTSS